MWKAEWLFHPECPGTRVLVVRTFLGRLLKPKDFATLSEVAVYHEYIRTQGGW